MKRRSPRFFGVWVRVPSLEKVVRSALKMLETGQVQVAARKPFCACGGREIVTDPTNNLNAEGEGIARKYSLTGSFLPLVNY